MAGTHTTDRTANGPSSAQGDAPALRRLYLVRSGFALVWAVLLFLNASDIGPSTAALLVLYPLFDVAAAVVDARSSRATGAAPGLYVNVVLSALAAAGLAVALASGVPAVLRVWGAWAVVAGIVQLVVALRRRRLGGQGAMIASGSLSVVAGTSFVVMASGAGASLSGVAGYALLGGVFFLASALRLGRVAGSR
ncbi:MULTISPECIES: hypothetical protein [Pseudonocardia]|jgi:uncharacterized membrane protein HdeD (DUF308 family)|uniref:hypothetical protein n=1 Tax=Pseudonocardia sp. SID8383 TaxID=2690363 RepID=UPI000923FB4B|nr:hypothetical protein [Pseudonocardia sp. SID8383]MYW74797.1 hypothetical protein [Pseudonocardia sp. SID8383]OJG06199.1 hypothetical protein BG618_02520 [Pseudonocardia autotrophica]